MLQETISSSHNSQSLVGYIYCMDGFTAAERQPAITDQPEHPVNRVSYYSTNEGECVRLLPASVASMNTINGSCHPRRETLASYYDERHYCIQSTSCCSNAALLPANYKRPRAYAFAACQSQSSSCGTTTSSPMTNGEENTSNKMLSWIKSKLTCLNWLHKLLYYYSFLLNLLISSVIKTSVLKYTVLNKLRNKVNENNTHMYTHTHTHTMHTYIHIHTDPVQTSKQNQKLVMLQFSLGKSSFI